jgi:AcrR family transcriptional regulator
MVKPIAEIRKPEIVQAAIAAIGRSGLPMPPYDQIAGEADMSRQLVRHYFPEPEELMLAVCDALAASYRQLLMQGIIQIGATERLPLFLDFYFDFLAGRGMAKPKDDQVYDAVFALAASSPAIRENLKAQYTELQSVVSHEVQISHPTLSQRACREIGFLFVSLMYGHWKMVASLGFSDSHNAVTRTAMDRIIASYVERYDDPDG